MTRGPSINRHNSRGDYGTPANFLSAVRNKFGSLVVDLAATAENAVCRRWIDPKQNSLEQPWHKLDGLLWLNPPFGNLSPWAGKCAVESKQDAEILLLVPASTGANWFVDYVHNRAKVYFLQGRLTFVGEIDPYPRDLILAHYDGGVMGYEVWDWKKDVLI